VPSGRGRGLYDTGRGVNAASVQDEARQFFERFVAAQNAHDLATVGSMLWNSEDFLGSLAVYRFEALKLRLMC